MDETLTILVVDDDEVDRMTVRRSFRQANLTIDLSEASDYANAIAILQQQTFDCIFIDYRLPDKDGLALVQDLRNAGVQTPLVILTGQADDQTAVELMKAGASDYLSKDRLSPKALSKCLHNVIRIHRAEMDAALANQRLRESEERYRFVLEGSNDGIWDWDLLRNKIYFNDRLFQIAGLGQDEFSTATFEDFLHFVHPDERLRFESAVAAHLDYSAPFDLEVRLQRSSGDERYCIVRAKAQRDIQGRPFRMAGVVIDITERRRAEEKLAVQNELLRQTIEERDQIASQREDFVSRLTHDLRTPLVAADRMLTLLRDDTFGPLSSQVHEVLEVMSGSNQNLLQMVNTLLEVYRYEAGRKSLTFAPFNILTLVREVIRELAPLAAEKQIDLGLELNAPFGPSTEKIEVSGDRIELRRVIVNLVGNAIKFTDQGSVTVRLREEQRSPTADPLATAPETEAIAHWLAIDVEDTGPGLSPSDQQLIFDRFRQTKDRRSGSGLGLYLSRRIVDEHHGTIGVQSQPGNGSTFTVQLPLAKVAVLA
ncbi:MAG: ATP-binding protein [Synechococcales bacterium]|nr:ATP-binding protein [Synechococcales bacterium]